MLVKKFENRSIGLFGDDVDKSLRFTFWGTPCRNNAIWTLLSLALLNIQTACDVTGLTLRLFKSLSVNQVTSQEFSIYTNALS